MESKYPYMLVFNLRYRNPVRPKYILHRYMDPLGLFLKLKLTVAEGEDSWTEYNRGLNNW